MFQRASALIINKVDLLPHVPCNLDTLRNNALSINPKLKIFETSCTTKKGIAEWCGWLISNLKSVELA
jgi:hydrogenase nickel incorporation protein HypB